MRTRRPESSFWALAAAAALGTVLGCSEEARGGGGMTAEQFAQARADAAKSATAAPVAPPPAVTPAAPQPTIDPISGVAQIQTGYSYDPTGKRDPFRSFI